MSTKKIDNFVWIIQLDMHKEAMAIAQPDHAAFNNAVLTEVLNILKHIDVSGIEWCESRVNFNIFIFGDVNLFVEQNKKLFDEILQRVQSIKTKKEHFNLNIHLMSRAYIKSESENYPVSDVTLENIFSYFNLGDGNVIILDGHGFPIKNTVTREGLDISELSFFPIHRLGYMSYNINAFTILDKIRLNDPSKNYIIIPLMCHGGEFIKQEYINGFNNVQFMLPAQCGTLGQSTFHRQIILHLLYADSQTLSEIIESLTFKFIILNNSRNQYSGSCQHYEFFIIQQSISRQKSADWVSDPDSDDAIDFNDDNSIIFSDDEGSGNHTNSSQKKYLKYKQKYLKYKQKYLQLKYILYNYK